MFGLKVGDYGLHFSVSRLYINDKNFVAPAVEVETCGGVNTSSLLELIFNANACTTRNPIF